MLGAHIVTVLTAFVAAPITSLNPTIGAGMVTAAVEIFIRKPTVKDFSDLRKDTSTAIGWRKNRVAKNSLNIFTEFFRISNRYVCSRVLEFLASWHNFNYVWSTNELELFDFKIFAKSEAINSSFI